MAKSSQLVPAARFIANANVWRFPLKVVGRNNLLEPLKQTITLRHS
jgi:hypothetical protein